MKTVIFFILPFVIVFHLKLNAQEVISCLGEYFSNANGSLSSTIGEPVTETLSGTEKILTQGFQQSYLVTSIQENYPSGLIISVFPNPTTNILNIKVEKADRAELSIKLFDSEGKVLQDNQFELPEAELTFKSLPSATYILKIYSGKNEMKAYKIIKR